MWDRSRPVFTGVDGLHEGRAIGRGIAVFQLPQSSAEPGARFGTMIPTSGAVNTK